MTKETDYLAAAARTVEMQAVDNPGIGIPADPDVADFMGAFPGDEDLADVLEAQLEVEPDGI